MFERLKALISLSKSQQGYLIAYMVVVFASILLSMMVMAGVEGAAAVPVEASNYAAWIMVSGGAAGAVALFCARGWFGVSGALGHARAVVGGLALTLVGAVVAGMLISPVQGAFFAPVMVATEFADRPIIGILWAAAIGVAHYAMLPRYRHQDLLDNLGVDPFEELPHDRFATSELSSLTRVNLYNQRY